MTTKTNDANDAMTVSETAMEMHKHFHENGYYRAEDMERVFGDPRDSVGFSVSSTFSLSARK